MNNNRHGWKEKFRDENHVDPSRILRAFADAAPEIRDADLLLFRRFGAIAVAGRGRHSHAAKAVWWNETLFCIEVREWYGGRAVPLETLVRRLPGRIDVYRADPDGRWPEYDRSGTVEVMKGLVGCPYGYGNLLRAAAHHLPVLRWIFRPVEPDPKENVLSGRLAPTCSQACCLADRLGGGVDPIPHLADRFSEPSDLARSPFYRYLLTLE